MTRPRNPTLLAQGVCVCKAGREESAVMSSISPSNPLAVPPGIATSIAEYAEAVANNPNWMIAQFTALTILSGVCGRGYNTYTGAGLNQYNAMLADTGAGKDTIDKVTGALFESIATIKEAAGLIGPGFIQSAPGLLRALEANPALIAGQGEFGKRLAEWNNPRNPNGMAIQVLLREVWGRSGKSKALGSSAYADTGKNTARILSPALTIAAEGTRDEFYQVLDDGIVAGGLLPRFNIFEYDGERAYSQNDNAMLPVPQALATHFGNIVAHSLSLAHRGSPCVVPADEQARLLLKAFDDECTDLINAGGEVTKQLWNRAHLKALKFASLSAISWNCYNPLITFADATWAISLIRFQTERLIGKFDRNEVGAVEGDEGKQRAAVLRIVAEYMSRDHAGLAKYDVPVEMHRRGVVTHSYLSRRLATLPAFSKDRIGATSALKRVIGRLLEDDELREIPPKQMTDTFGSKPKAYVIANSKTFLSAL